MNEILHELIWASGVAVLCLIGFAFVLSLIPKRNHPYRIRR